MTDHYELTMIDAALANGTAHRRCLFEVFTRRLPAGRRYGVFAGGGRVLEDLARFRFGDEELSFLAKNKIVSPQTLDWLANYRFTGNITGFAEGECYFPNTPLMMVEATFAEAVILETLVLSILNYDSAVAAAASRITSAALDRPCLEMGARRANEEAAVAAARSAVIAGFVGTSDLEAGRRYGLPTIGTAAHAFTLLHDDEKAAFAAQIATLGKGTTLLVDTYDTMQGVRNAIEVAGTELGAVRIDSGDLSAIAQEVRDLLDSLGATKTKITVSSDLDEYSIASLAVAPVNSYGVGTSVVTGSGAPTCFMVYKLVGREGPSGELEPATKKSAMKQSTGGRKNAARRLDSAGRAVDDIVITGRDSAVANWRPESTGMRGLHVPLVVNGEIDDRWTGADAVTSAAARHRESLAELPRGARRLSKGEPALDVVEFELD
jgi:nicotinate phosphoribosyltransferase